VSHSEGPGPAPPREPSEAFANNREPSASPREPSSTDLGPWTLDLGPWTLEEDLRPRTKDAEPSALRAATDARTYSECRSQK
jgi:hypothetical protein